MRNPRPFPFESVGRRAVAPVLLALLAGFPLAAQPREQRPAASGFGAGAEAEHPGGGSCRCPWSEERARVVDLMLDGAFAEALARCEELLADPALPASVARRVAELRTRAVRELERRDLQQPDLQRGNPERPDLERSDSGRPDVERRAAVAASPAPEPDRPPPLDVTFHVRSTRPGRSFREGHDGRLRVSAQGITFVPDDGADGSRWTVRWDALAVAQAAEGIWDVAHPLVVETEEGDRFFLVQIGPEDRFGDGEQILRYIEKGRKRFVGSMDKESE